MNNTNIKKQYQQIKGLIQRLTTTFTFCRLVLLSLRSFVTEYVFVCCLQVCLACKTISCQTDKKNRVKHSQIMQGNCLKDAVYSYLLSELRPTTLYTQLAKQPNSTSLWKWSVLDEQGLVQPPHRYTLRKLDMF